MDNYYLSESLERDMEFYVVLSENTVIGYAFSASKSHSHCWFLKIKRGFLLGDLSLAFNPKKQELLIVDKEHHDSCGVMIKDTEIAKNTFNFIENCKELCMVNLDRIINNEKDFWSLLCKTSKHEYITKENLIRIN